MTPETTTIDQPSSLAGTPNWTALDIPPVTSPEHEQNVTDYMNLAKSFQTRVTEFFKPHRDRAHKAWKGLCDSENAVLKPAMETEAACKRALGAYRLECEARARQERDRLEAIARQEAEERRVREAAALEAQANATPDLVEAFEIRREAEALITAPAQTPVVSVPVQPKATGTTYIEKFRGVMLKPSTDKAKLIIAVAAQCAQRPELLALFDLNDSQANKLAGMVKVHEKEILPGLMCVREINVAGRRR